MATALQRSLFGGEIAVGGTIVDKLTYILEEHPEARDDYMAAMFRYWQQFDGLGEVLGEKAEAFLEWFTSQATSVKTLQNRAMEIQRRRGDLDASSDVRKWRDRQAKAGPVM